MEPQWTKQISSNTICSTYQAIFWIYAVLAVLAFIGTLSVLVAFKLPKGMSVAIGFQGILVSLVTGTLALFQYLVCARALLEKPKGAELSQ